MGSGCRAAWVSGKGHQSPGSCQLSGKAWSLPVLFTLPGGAAPNLCVLPSPAGLPWCTACPEMCVRLLELYGFAVGLEIPSVPCLGRD